MAKDHRIFDWDDIAIGKVENPMLLVARAFAIADALACLEREGGTGYSGVSGFMDSLGALTRNGNYKEAGALLNSVEAIVRPQMGNEWPLDEVL